ncbi:MAG: hypothetical protein ACM31E_12275 [Fibrobacterota bacterium]|nr:hypothetical protein [Chitinispirillaceae bacterium]
MTILKVNRLAVVSVVLGAALLTGQSFADSSASDTLKGKKQVSVPAKQLKPQTTCPVYGGDIDKSQFVDINGKRIYVCCAACIAEIKKDPDKYIKKLESMGQGVEAIPQKTKSTGSAPAKTNIMDHSTMKH